MASRFGSFMLVGAFVVLGLTVAVGPPGSEVRAAESSGCEQWEVMVEVEQVSLTATRPPAYGQPQVKKVAAGWEPFAVGQSGLLLQRRCAR
jgi:hypothetical protein